LRVKDAASMPVRAIVERIEYDSETCKHIIAVRLAAPPSTQMETFLHLNNSLSPWSASIPKVFSSTHLQMMFVTAE